MTDRSRRETRWAIVALVLLGLLIHLPGLGRPFGPLEPNPGCYFGSFVNNYEHFGFGAMRGVPVGAQGLTDLATGLPYLNHPPGLSWLFYAIGTDEWQMRLPTAFGATAAAVLTFLLLLGAFELLPALAGGLLALVSPVLVLYSQASYETVLLPLGLLLCLAQRRIVTGTDRPTAWRLALAAAAFTGPWIDWAFAFFCVALVPLSWQPSLRNTVRTLLLPAAVSLAAVITIVAWRAWAILAPGLPPLTDGKDFVQLLADNVFNRPPWSESLSAAGTRMTVCYTLPVLVASGLGIAFAWRRDRALLLGLLLAGALNPIAFPIHAISHDMYYAYAASLVATGCAGLVWAARRRPLRIALIALLLPWPAAASYRAVTETATPFFRDLGAVLTRATGHGSPGGERWLVAHSYLHFYGYYVDSPMVLIWPTRDPQKLADGVANLAPGLGARYLWLRVDGSQLAGSSMPERDDLARYLARFPMERVPELEVEFAFTSSGDLVRVREAWLVTLRTPD